MTSTLTSFSCFIDARYIAVVACTLLRVLQSATVTISAAEWRMGCLRPPHLYLPRYKGGDPLGESQNLSRYTIRRSQAAFGDAAVEDERFAAPAECPSRRVSEGLTAAWLRRTLRGRSPTGL